LLQPAISPLGNFIWIEKRFHGKNTEIPEGAYESVKEGWTTYYWDPLKELLEK
jgi:hypothetical protein